MEQENSVLSELASGIGKASSPRSEVVEKGAIRRFINALSDQNPLYEDDEFAGKSRYGGKIAPPLFALTFNRRRRPQPDPVLAELGMSGLNAGNEFEFFEPIREGDVITHTTKLIDVKERTGKLGRMFIRTNETICTNQNGKKVAVCRWITIAHEGGPKGES